MNQFKVRNYVTMAKDLVRAHGAKHAYGITLKYPRDKYFQQVGKYISKNYHDELSKSDKVS